MFYNKSTILTFLLVPVNLLLFFILKQWLNGLSLIELNIFYPGNILNIVLAFAVLFGLVIHTIKNNEGNSFFNGLILFFQFLSFLFLLGLLFINHFKIIPHEIVLARLSMLKIVNASVLMGSQLINLFCTSLMWKKLFSNKPEIYIRAITTSVLISVFMLIFTYIYIHRTPPGLAKNDKYEVGVVLGAAVWSNNTPSPLLAGRLETAFSLFKQSKLKYIHLTGSNAPGELSEAAAGRKYLFNLGMKPWRKNLLIEEKTATTSEQIKFISEELKNFKSIAVISDEFHLTRVLEMAKFFEVNIKDIPSKYKINLQKLVYLRLRESLALLIFWLIGI